MAQVHSSVPQSRFKFTIASITSLLDFRSSDLFPAEAPSFGCEAHRAELKKDHKANRYYYNATVNGTVVKEFCDYLSREAFEYAIRQRRSSLKRAIDVYMEEVILVWLLSFFKFSYLNSKGNRSSLIDFEFLPITATEVSKRLLAENSE